MKICLVRPPSIVSPVVYIASLTPPIGLAYVCSALRDAGHEVTLIDGVGEAPMQSEKIAEGLVSRGLSFDEVIERIPSDCDLIGISAMFSAEWPQIGKLVNKIGERFPDKWLVGGGEHFTAAPEVSMDTCPDLDVCVLGEGEESIVELAQCLEQQGDLSEVSGIIYRNGNDYTTTKSRARKKNLSTISRPAWDQVPLHNYFDNFLSYGVFLGRSMPILASRGCPYQCTFCSNKNMWQARWFVRDVQEVVDEIEDYKNKYQATNFDFYDLTAIIRKDWIIEFSQELIKRKLNITWQLPSGTRSEAIDREVAEYLYESGCRNLNYAPESGSTKTLKEIKKKIKLSSMLDSLRDSVKAKLNIKINIILGLPDETHLDIWKTMFFILRLSLAGAHDISVGVFAPYPGSPLYERLVKEGKISHSEEYWTKLAYVDISETVSYSNHVSSSALRIYNWLGFAIFYGSNYIARPWRAAATFVNIATGNHKSRGEMALATLSKRVLSYLRLRKN